MEDNKTITLEENRHTCRSQQRIRAHRMNNRPGEHGGRTGDENGNKEWGEVYRYNTAVLSTHSNEQRIRGRVLSWGSNQSLVSPSRNVVHVRSPNKFIASNRTSPTSNTRAPLASDDSVFHVTRLLGDGVPTGESTERTANRARPATAVRRGELAGGVTVPPWLLVHLSVQLRQYMGWQLSVGVGLGHIITKLGRVVAIVYHRWVLVRNW